MEMLAYHRRSWGPVGRLTRELMLLYGLDIPPQVEIGPGLRFQHRGMGTVIHPLTVIEANVTIYHQVTIGRRDARLPMDRSRMVRVEIGTGAILYPGAKILAGPGVTRIGRNAIIGANAVVTCSVPGDQIWAGNPASFLHHRAPL